MRGNRFIIGIPEERVAWRQVIGTPNIEAIHPLNPQEYLARAANLDVEILTASLCAMSLNIHIQEDSAGIHSVQDIRCAPLVLAPPLDPPLGELEFVKSGDSEEVMRKSANYAIALHKWSRVFEALRQWLASRDGEYRIGFNCNWVDFRPRNDTEEMAVVLAFLDVFPKYGDLFQ